MRIGAFTLTFNRLELTKATFENIKANSKLDYHLYIDQGSEDGTQEWIEANCDNYILLKRNIGISKGMELAMSEMQELDLDLVIKLDNDIEIVTPKILDSIKKFYAENGFNYILSPLDLTIDPNYKPREFGRLKLGEFTFIKTTHTGGAFLVMPKKAFLEMHALKRKEDMDIGSFFRANKYITGYLADLKINHKGLNLSTSHEKYIF